MNCSRDFALCVLLGMEFTPANVIKASSKLESYGLEVCYDSAERNPILVPKNRINYNPYTYKRTLSTPPPKTIETENNILLTSDSQLSQCVNATFSHLNLENNENYELKYTRRVPPLHTNTTQGRNFSMY
ncbi:hypothetical protein INT47_001820 [Mucor saturninus]|uniref:Uncharacterized protein n=1 Tax=Mucor saturninus TaxID=64648 RepID=A0A8H7UN91_9FUNG|nr:hypothetical protein INT47_001820 [Mucor saturninus]